MKTLNETLAEATVKAVKEALIANNGHIQRTCNQLDIYPKRLQLIRKKYPVLEYYVNLHYKDVDKFFKERRRMNRRFPDREGEVR